MYQVKVKGKKVSKALSSFSATPTCHQNQIENLSKV